MASSEDFQSIYELYKKEGILTKFPLSNSAIRMVSMGIERSVFFNGQQKWVKGFENQMV